VHLVEIGGNGVAAVDAADVESEAVVAQREAESAGAAIVGVLKDHDGHGGLPVCVCASARGVGD
jgi:hypothetical protein